MTRETFFLDPRLQADGPPVGELGICHVRLVDDARFFWVVLVPRIAGAVEVFDLPPFERVLVMEEIAAAAAAVKTLSACAKINVAMLGNVVSQLHIHVVARNPEDPAWPAPVFGFGKRAPMPPAGREDRLALLRRELRLG